MQKLNIPLSRNHRTTRRNRWVVWQLAFLVMLLLFFASMSRALLQRNTLMSAAPDETSVALFLTPNNSNRAILSELLGTIPLISNRSLTLDDLEPYANGRLAVFFNENGSRSVALRSKKQELPLDTLDGHHVNVQEVKPGLLLLSETLQPVSGMDSSWNWAQLLPRIRKTSLGAFIGSESLRPAPLLATEDRIDLSLKDKVIPKKADVQLPPNAIGFISNPLSAELTNSGATFFSNLVDPVLKNSLSSFTDALFSENGLVVLTNSDGSTGFLLESANTSIGKQERVNLLKTVSSLQNPTVLKRNLQDGSLIREITVDPGAISIEERTILGTQTLRTSSHGKGTYSLTSDGAFIFTNNEDLLRFSLDKDGNSEVQSFCEGNAVGADVKTLIHQHENNITSYQPSLLRVVTEKFIKFGAKKHGGRLTLRLCK